MATEQNKPKVYVSEEVFEGIRIKDDEQAARHIVRMDRMKQKRLMDEREKSGKKY